MTCTTFAGTWRGVVLARIVCLIRVGERLVERQAVLQLHEQHDAHVAASRPGGQSWPMTRLSTTSGSCSTWR